jgi:hypothetical protein
MVQQKKPPRPHVASARFGPPPNDTEWAVVIAAKALTENITDPKLLDEAVSKAVAYLQSSPLVAKVSRDGNTIDVLFKSGREAAILAELAPPPVRPQSVVSGGSKKATHQAVSMGAGLGQVAQGRWAVILTPFHFEFPGDPSWDPITDNYIDGLVSAGIYQGWWYVPNDYFTIDEFANFLLGWEVYAAPEVVVDTGINHVSYGLWGLFAHGGIANGLTIFATGECARSGPTQACGAPQYPTHGSASADYWNYYNIDPSFVIVTGVSGDSRGFIAVSSNFVYYYGFLADFTDSPSEYDSLFYAMACDGSKQSDMYQALVGSGARTYLAWTDEAHEDPGDYAYSNFFYYLTNGYDAADSYTRVCNAGYCYDGVSGAYLHYYGSGGQDTGGDWNVYWPNVYVGPVTIIETATVHSITVVYNTFYLFSTRTVYTTAHPHTTVTSTTQATTVLHTTITTTATTYRNTTYTTASGS